MTANGLYPLPGRIRRGRARDEDQIRWITEVVFHVFGEYGSWLPSYLGHPGVWTFVYEEESTIRGFSMLGVLEPSRGSRCRTADLLAIAVRPEDQGRGIGPRLLDRTAEQAHGLHHSIALAELRLTVAETNMSARKLFSRFGFEQIDGDHGYYEKGQRALRLQLLL